MSLACGNCGTILDPGTMLHSTQPPAWVRRFGFFTGSRYCWKSWKKFQSNTPEAKQMGGHTFREHCWLCHAWWAINVDCNTPEAKL